MRAIFPELNLDNHDCMDLDPSAPLAQGLVMHAPLNEGNGLVVQSADGAIRGKVIGISTLFENSPFMADVWKPGRTGMCAEFKQNVAIGFPTHSSTSLDCYTQTKVAVNLSAGVWIRPTAVPTGSYYTLFAKCPGTTPAQYQVSLNTTDGSLLYYNGTVYSTTYIPPAYAWTFVMVTVRGTQLKFYANGRLVNEQTMSAEGAVGIGPVIIGWNGRTTSTEHFVGQMEHFYLYNRPLLAGEVAELYANPWAPEKATNKRHWNISGFGLSPPPPPPATKSPFPYSRRTMRAR